jgi:enoyl-CoA hydratase/carnithine racemase
MGYQSLLVDRVDGIATLTMNRPEARNALDIRMREELVEALDEIERDPAVRAVILTGAGGHFSAGGDVKTMAARRHTAAEGREQGARGAPQSLRPPPVQLPQAHHRHGGRLRSGSRLQHRARLRHDRGL